MSCLENTNRFLYTYPHVLLLRSKYMKIVLDKELLHDGMQTASRFTSKRLSTIQSLQGALLTVEKDTIQIFATNLNTHFVTTIPVKLSGKGAIRVVVDPKKIAEFLALLSPGDVALEIDEKKITLQKEKNHGTFPVMEEGDFPKPPIITQKPLILNADHFKKHLPLILFAASRDESRPALSGVNFVANGSDLITVSTDGFRLSLMKDKNTQNMPSVLIARGFLEEVLQGVKDEKTIEFGFLEKEKTVWFKGAEKLYFSRVIEGSFPPYEKVIPVEKKQTITTDKDELLRNIKIASLFAREQSNIVVFAASKGILTIKPKTDSSDENNSSQDAEVEGEEIPVAFNARFLLEFLQAVPGKKVTVELLRSDAPVVFRSDSLKNFLHIIMPVRIQV